MGFLYNLYRKYRNIPLIGTCAYFVSDRVQGLWDVNRRYVCKKIEPVKREELDVQKKQMDDIKIAYICDEMTYSSFSELTQSVFLTPWNWYEMMEREKPDIFFCESAWTGIKQYEGCWRGRIYKSSNVKYNNRKVLLNILNYCKVHQIRTVFWNKEDPTFFGNKQYDFIDTALHFDYIFTTAEECVARYEELGHKNVHALPFGVSAKLYNPTNSADKENVAIFAGSWYPEYKERCADMERMFEQVLSSDIRLEIYDRNFNNTKTVNHFPEKYAPYISGYVPFEEMGKKVKHARYAVNVNSVTDSKTMFARRVFEMMASNVAIISNESLGMRELFGKRVWFVGEDFEKENIEEICRENVQDVFEHHTNQMRMRTLLKVIGILQERQPVRVSVVRQTAEQEVQIEQLTHENIQIRYFADIKDVPEDCEFFLIERNETFDDAKITQMLVHYQYLDKNAAISFAGERYKIVDTSEYTDALIPYENYAAVKEGRSILKYVI